MKQIKALVKRMRDGGDITKKYPEIKWTEKHDQPWPADDGKCHILFISPYENGTGLYRAILPCLHINESKSHSAIISNIAPHGEGFNQFNNVDFEWSPQIIAWAHYIVLPTIAIPLDHAKEITAEEEKIVSMIDVWRSINPNLRFVFDIDDNYINIPNTHPNYYKINKDMKKALLGNIALCDIFTTSTIRGMEFYKNIMTEKYPDNKVSYVPIPNLISEKCYENIDKFDKMDSDKVRIGMVLNQTQFSDINPFKKILKTLNKKYGSKVEIIVFGWNGVLHNSTGRKNMNRNALSGVEYTFVLPVPLLDYFSTLMNLQFDFALMPLANNPEDQYQFNLLKSNHKYLQYAAFGIPAIVSDIETYTGEEGIKDGENILVAKDNADWLQKIDMLINDPKERKRIGKNAFEYATGQCTLNEESTAATWLSLFQ